MGGVVVLLSSFRGQSYPKRKSTGQAGVAIMLLCTIFLLWLAPERWNFCLCVWRLSCFKISEHDSATADSRGKSLTKLPSSEKYLLYKRQIKKNTPKNYITNDKSKLKVCFACCHSLPFIFRKQTAVIIDLMVQLEWKHFWA